MGGVQRFFEENYKGLFAYYLMMASCLYSYGFCFVVERTFPLIKPYAYKRTLEERASLEFNRDDYTAFVVQKSEAEGVKDMHALLRESPYEENWMHVPEKDTWYELGVERLVSIDRKGSFKSQTRLSVEFIDRYLEDNPETKEIVLYHNHPPPHMLRLENIIAKAVPMDDIVIHEERSDRLSKELAEVHQDNKATIDALSYSISDWNARPSAYDLHAIISYTLRWKDYPVKVIGKICSSSGVTEYHVTDEGKEFFGRWKRNADPLGKASFLRIMPDRIESSYLNIRFIPHR